MSCQHCVGSVTKALLAVPGVESARVDLDAARADVQGNAQRDALVEAVRRAGYVATAQPA
jgi:copper chaperone CopZ